MQIMDYNEENMSRQDGFTDTPDTLDTAESQQEVVSDTPDLDASAETAEPAEPEATPNVNGYYNGQGAGRQEYCGGYNGYTNYNAQNTGYYTGSGTNTVPPYRPNTYTIPPRKPKKQARGKHRAAQVAAACLVCAILGGIGGGAIMSGIANKNTRQMQQSLQQQIDALSNQQPSSGNSDSKLTPIANTTGLSAAQVYQQNVNSVVYIESTVVVNYYGQQTTGVSSGSGFIISEDGYILSNYHVVENSTKLNVKMYDGSSYEATLVGYDKASDVAVLKVEATGLPAVTVGDSDAVNVGDQVVAIGNPLGELTSTLTGGYVSAKDRTINTDNTLTNMIQTDAAINSGNSGGPLFNMNGEVIGITSAKYSGSSSSGASIEGIGFAIPINSVMNMVEDLKQYGYVTGQAYMGVTLEEIDTKTASVYGLPAGVYVNSVAKGSCSAIAGIQKGDIITGLNGADITCYDDLAAALKKFGAGDTTTISIYRQGQTLELQITFDEKKGDMNNQTESAEEDETESTAPSDNREQPEGDYNQWYDYFAPFFGR